MKLILLLPLVAVSLLAASSINAAEAEAPKPDKDGWYQLFNGKDLKGWKVTKENPDTFRVEDGVIIVNGERAHAFYDGPVNEHNFKNFEWKCEINSKPHSNSGMYFHTEYQEEGWPEAGIEVQVNNTYDPDPRKTGSVYGVKDVMNNSPAKDNEWFTQHVIVEGNKVTIKVNDKVVNEYTQPEDATKGGEKRAKILKEGGTFAIQGHDPGSEVHYRKIMVKPLP